MLIEYSPIPCWALTPQNHNTIRLKYQHLVLSLRRRIQSAIDSNNQKLVLELQQELSVLEREI